MAYEFKLPDLGEGLTEGEVARWLVSEGQDVAEDDPLVEIQTDKTTVEIPSPAAGKVAKILVGEGEVVPVGTVLVVIGDGAAPAAEPKAEPQPERPRAGDAARPEGGAGARRRSRARGRDWTAGPDHRGGCAAGRRPIGGAPRAAAWCSATDRRPHGACSPRGAARDVG